MIKNKKITIEQLAEMIAKGFKDVATKNDIKDMATKTDIADVRADISDIRKELGRLEFKIDGVAETVQQLDEVDIRDLQRRVYALEKSSRTHNRNT